MPGGGDGLVQVVCRVGGNQHAMTTGKVDFNCWDFGTECVPVTNRLFFFYNFLGGTATGDVVELHSTVEVR